MRAKGIARSAARGGLFRPAPRTRHRPVGRMSTNQPQVSKPHGPASPVPYAPPRPTTEGPESPAEQGGRLRGRSGHGRRAQWTGMEAEVGQSLEVQRMEKVFLLRKRPWHGLCSSQVAPPAQEARTLGAPSFPSLCLRPFLASDLGGFSAWGAPELSYPTSLTAKAALKNTAPESLPAPPRPSC